MELNFSNEDIRNRALSTTSAHYENNISSEDAFLILLNGLDYEIIDNLCYEVSNKLSMDKNEVYNMIQNFDKSLPKDILLDTAYEMIHSNKKIGNKIVNGKHNASAWISHSLYEGEVASNFANLIGLNPDTARKLGILHDIGRRFDHSFMHTIKGYEYLTVIGLKDEAVIALSHSFLPIFNDGNLRGNRCANCDPSLEGFYVNENGEGVFEDESQKDDMALFLDNYQYNMYDNIINISDLMAMSKGITSPYERMLDVYSKRVPDSKNSPFFKICFVNTLLRMLFSLTKDEIFLTNYNIKDFPNVEDIDNLLIETSNTFMSVYLDLMESNKEVSRK